MTIHYKVHEGPDPKQQPAIEILEGEDPVLFGSAGEAFEWTLDEIARQRRVMSELMAEEREIKRRFDEARAKIIELQKLENDLEICL